MILPPVDPTWNPSVPGSERQSGHLLGGLHEAGIALLQQPHPPPAVRSSASRNPNCLGLAESQLLPDLEATEGPRRKRLVDAPLALLP